MDSPPVDDGSLYTERQREKALSLIARHQQELDRLATPIVKADLPALGEAIASVEKAALTFAKQMRTLL